MTESLSVGDINHLYKTILFRDGDQSGINHHLNSNRSLDEIAALLKKSGEYNNQIKPTIDKLNSVPGKKVLLFGAYGNGNLGDAIQQNFLKKSLTEAGFDGSIWSCSHMDYHYNFDSERKIPGRFIKSAEFLNLFDLIIIGGGGLLSHPHYPLNIPDWSDNISTPIALLAVGATNLAAPLSEKLIKKSFHVSGRDEASFSCLSKYRDDIKMVPDPVLSMQEYTYSETDSNKTAWILKGPMDDSLLEIKKHIKDNDVVICFQKKLDQQIEHLFPELIYTPTEESFYKAIDGCDTAFSMRYHGLILALSKVKSLYAMGDPKNISLMRKLNIENNFFKNVDELKNFPNLYP